MSPLKRKLLIVGAVVFAVLVIDQIIKIWIKTSLTPFEEIPISGDWFKLMYIENQGMAFGTTFGSSMWAKLGLSVFRIVAIIAIGYYWWKQAKKGVKTGLLIAIGFIFAGATGNLIDSMFYDFIFDYDPCISFNHLEGSGIWNQCGGWGKYETRHTGFLMGNVVDMFQVNLTWPAWMPWVGSTEVFPAIWNIADGSITIGVVMIILRQRSFFAGDVSSEEMNRELTSMRKVGLFGGIGMVVLYTVLSLGLITVPAEHAFKAFIFTLALYLISIYITSRLANLLGRSALLWVLLAIVVPVLPLIALSRLEQQDGGHFTPEESAAE
jgi:signal peptidase II